jgi:endonuclease/exonuclease/phosphatase family metal-dependent hydrolase
MTDAQLRRRRRPPLAVACVVVGLAMVMSATVLATTSGAKTLGRRFKPMTYNVYLGADLQPLFGVTDPDELMRRAAEVFAHVEKVDFDVRAVALAREIIDADPDVVALQEVSLWGTAPLSNPRDITVRYDFLTILLHELTRQGAGYRAAIVNPTFSGQLRISATTLGLFTDRNAIIVRSSVPSSELSIENSAQGTYEAALTVPILDQTLVVYRGWASIDVHVRDRWYTVIDTHLEAFVPAIREAQVSELVGIIEAADHPVVLAGDLNVYPEGYRVVDAEEWQMFDSVGLVDSWVEADEAVAFTAGQSDDLDNEPSALDNMVDFVLHDSADTVEAVEGSGHIAGEELDDRTDTVPPLWPSDHAGVVVTLRAAVP